MGVIRRENWEEIVETFLQNATRYSQSKPDAYLELARQAESDWVKSVEVSGYDGYELFTDRMEGSDCVIPIWDYDTRNNWALDYFENFSDEVQTIIVEELTGPQLDEKTIQKGATFFGSSEIPIIIYDSFTNEWWPLDRKYGLSGIIHRTSAGSWGFNRYLKEHQQVTALHEMLKNICEENPEDGKENFHTKFVCRNGAVRGAVSNRYTRTDTISIMQSLSYGEGFNELLGEQHLEDCFLNGELQNDSFTMRFSLTPDIGEEEKQWCEEKEVRFNLEYQSGDTGRVSESMRLNFSLGEHTIPVYQTGVSHKATEKTQEEVLLSQLNTLSTHLNERLRDIISFEQEILDFGSEADVEDAVENMCKRFKFGKTQTQVLQSRLRVKKAQYERQGTPMTKLDLLQTVMEYQDELKNKIFYSGKALSDSTIRGYDKLMIEVIDVINTF